MDELWELACAYLTLYGSSGANVSPHTRAAYRRGIVTLIEAWAGVSLLRATRDDAAVWIRSMETEGLKASTIQVRLAGARTLYKALRWSGVTEIDPLSDIRPAKDPTPAHAKRSPYPDSDVERLLNIATGDDRILILLGAHAGLRVSEAMSLQWTDIDTTARRLTVQKGKGGKKRHVPCTARLIAALADAPRSSSYVISAYRTPQHARRRLERVCAQAGTRYLAAHALRHSCGTKIYRQTGRLEDAQHLLGHSQIATTQIYAAYADDGLRRAVDDW